MNTKDGTMMHMDQDDSQTRTRKGKPAMNCSKMDSRMMERDMMRDGIMMSDSTMSQKEMMVKTMRHRAVVVIAAAVFLAGLWYLFRPELLFIDKTVNEATPIMGSAMSGTVRAEGTFEPKAHDTQGMATIIELADGKRVLRLSDFETSNGPDVHVLLAKATDSINAEMAKDSVHLDLGSLKGNIGDQNYDIPANVMLSEYNAVKIWCKRFNVDFGAAPLRMH